MEYHISGRDAATIVEALRALHTDCTYDSLPQRMVAAVKVIMPDDIVTYNEVDLVRRQLVRKTDPPNVEPWMQAAFEAHMNEHPLVRYCSEHPDGPAMRVSDFLTRRAFHRLGLYQEFFRHVGVEYQMSVALAPVQPLVVGMAVSRSRRDYTDRERALLTELRPHLASAYQTAHRFQRVNRRLARTESALESTGRGVILLDDERRVLLCTARAMRSLETFFPDSPPIVRERLPDRVDQWLQQQLAQHVSGQVRRPCAVVRQETMRLTMTFAPAASEGGHLLLMDEQAIQFSAAPLRILGLAAREADVLARIAEGRTNRETALALGLSPRTVQKHLEHIFRKLGVATRGAAIVRAMEVLGRGG